MFSNINSIDYLFTAGKNCKVKVIFDRNHHYGFIALYNNNMMKLFEIDVSTNSLDWNFSTIEDVEAYALKALAANFAAEIDND